MKEYLKKIKSSLKQVWEYVDDSVEEIGKWIDKIWNATGKVVDSNLDKAGDIADSGMKKAKEKTAQVGKKVEKAVGEKVKKVATSIKKEAKKAPPKPMFDFWKVSDELQWVIDARIKAKDFIKETPLEKSERLSKLYEADIYLKREDRTKVRSYKIRGAFNLISGLSLSEKQAWVVCASAGNHAQWFAITCAHLKVMGTVFMPVTTPEQKVHKTKRFGGEYIDIQLVGDTFDEAFAQSKVFEEESWATFVHPFDDPRIIEWQAGVAIEIIKQLGEKPDIVICPIGWGWISAGIINVLSELSPTTEIIGVEPAGAPAMKESLEKGKLTALNKLDIFVDGAAVKTVGKTNFAILKKSKVQIHTVPENRVCSTILEYLKEDGIVVEPAGALSTDVLKDIKEQVKWKKVVVVVSGWNFDFERLPEIKERSRKFEWLKRYFLVSFPQRPGALKDFLACLWPDDDIARFEYLKKSNKDKAPVFIGIETIDKKNFAAVTKKMEKKWFKYTDITDDDLVFDLLV